MPDATNPQAFNRYTYVLNSPFTLIDPSGHRPSDGCDYEGCSLLNGFDSDSTWQAPDGTQTPWDPVVASDQDYNPITEAVIPATVTLLGVAALPTVIGYFAGEFIWPAITTTGTSIASWLCLDGDCLNELEIATEKLNYLLNSQGKMGGFERLGFTNGNAEALQKTLYTIGQQIDTSIGGQITEYGVKFTQSAEIYGPNGVIGRINTVWQIDKGATALRFITGWAEPFK